VPRVLLANPAAAPRPTLQGLTLHTDRSNDKQMTVIGIHVLGGVQVLPGPYGTLKAFEACSFDSGIGHGPHGPPDTNDVDSILIRNCTIRGDVELRVGQFTMESDTVVAGGVSLQTVNCARSVRNCWFRGPGISSLYFGSAGLSVEEMAPGSATVAGNVVEDCQAGMGLEYVSSALIEDNVVRNCQTGISVRSAGPSSLLNNDVRQCDRGIDVDSNEAPTRVNGNTVVGARLTGIAVQSRVANSVVELRSNVALRCGGTGIRLAGEEYGGLTRHIVAGNTSALNGGSGYDLVLDAHYGPYIFDVSNNVGYGNGAWGLRWTGPVPVSGCNDWFANASGSTYGAPLGATDLLVDPFFCDLGNDDVRLRSDSPLVGGACGAIGARGIGCDASTEVLVALFAAEASDQAVGLRWRLGGDEQPVSVGIERASAEQGPWQTIVTERSREGDVTVDWDRGAEPGRRYWYRLAWTTADGEQSYSSPIEVVLTSYAQAFALRAIGPNPASGPVAIEYTLPLSTAIDLTVHDLLGREVTRLASGVQTSGLHVTQWTGEVRGGRAGPGVYFVRLAYPGGQRSQRILLRR